MQEHGETLRASANNELRITEADINQMHGQIRDMLPRTKAEVEKQIVQIHAALEKGLARTQSLLLRAWFRPLMVGLVISLGIFGASWGLMQWLSSRVQNLLETQETLQLGIAQQQRDFEQLQAQTWGVWLHEEDGIRYVVLPRGDVQRGVARDRGRAACRQAFERVKEWYDRTRKTLDGRLSRALEAMGGGSGSARRGTGQLARAESTISRSW